VVEPTIGCARNTEEFMTHDYRDLTRLVRDAGLLERQPRDFLGRLLAAMGLLALGILLLTRARGPWALALVAAYLAVVTVQLAFLVHDAGHRQAFTRPWQNALAGILVGDLLIGVSYGWWIRKHDAHHANPNHLDLDPDIDLPLIAFSPEQVAGKRGLARLITAHQAWCAAPLLTLVAYGQHFSSTHFLLTARSRYRRWEALALLAHVALYVGLPLATLGPWATLLLVAVHQSCTGLYLGPNHKGMALADGATPLDPLRAQVLTARNVRGGPLVDWWYGGLNYQIEHHLFPALPRNRLRAARPLVRTFCAARGIPYHETSLIGSYREIVAYLHELGAPLRAHAAVAVMGAGDRHDHEIELETR
jgi:fatty acid desaturase